MRLRVIDWLVCPECGAELRLVNAEATEARMSDEVSPPSECRACRIEESRPHWEHGIANRECNRCYELEIMGGGLVCDNGHGFEIGGGVPKFLRALDRAPGPGAGRSSLEGQGNPFAIKASFDREWEHFEYEDRTWAMEVSGRAELALRELDCSSEEMRGRVLLDAGCGNGSLSRALNRYGCEVVAVDVSSSVEKAFQYFARAGNDRTHFIQADLMRLPLRAEAFDFVYASGVLHHNPSTRAAFESVVTALRPGGKVYIWVYHKQRGLRNVLKRLLRAAIVPLPGPFRHAFVVLWLPQAMLRQYLRVLLRRSGPEDRLKWRERLVLLLDHYTCRYRWEHTQEEVHEWYRGLRMQDIATTEVRQWGFGVVGRKPCDSASARADSSTTSFNSHNRLESGTSSASGKG